MSVLGKPCGLADRNRPCMHFVGSLSHLSAEIERFFFTQRDCSHYNWKLCMSSLLALLHSVTGPILTYRAQLREYFRSGVDPTKFD